MLLGSLATLGQLVAPVTRMLGLSVQAQQRDGATEPATTLDQRALLGVIQPVNTNNKTSRNWFERRYHGSNLNYILSFIREYLEIGLGIDHHNHLRVYINPDKGPLLLITDAPNGQNLYSIRTEFFPDLFGRCTREVYYRPDLGYVNMGEKGIVFYYSLLGVDHGPVASEPYKHIFWIAGQLIGIRGVTREVIPAHNFLNYPVQPNLLNPIENQRMMDYVTYLEGLKVLVAYQDGLVYLIDPASGQPAHQNGYESIQVRDGKFHGTIAGTTEPIQLDEGINGGSLRVSEHVVR